MTGLTAKRALESAAQAEKGHSGRARRADLSFIGQLDERLSGDGPSWQLTVVGPLGRGPGRLRRSQTGGSRYYQLTFAPAVRQSILGPTQLGNPIRVRIPLLGQLSAAMDRQPRQ